MSQADPLAELPELLPRLLRGVSIGRAQMVIDQVKAALATGIRDQIQLVSVAAKRRESGDHRDDIRAAVVLHWDSERATTATVLVAGIACDPAKNLPRDTWVNDLWASLAAELDRTLAAASIEFVQWATDPVEVPEVETDRATGVRRDVADSADATVGPCTALDFTPAATLRYLSGDLTSAVPKGGAVISPDLAGGGEALQSRPVNVADVNDWRRMVRCVERTYRETMDCPVLTEFRTAEQTVGDYRTAHSFWAPGWMTLHLAGHAEPVGCVILGMHHATDGATDGRVVELVYMGVVPEHRGRALGRAIVQLARSLALANRATRMIVAVDVRNKPAIAAYERYGMKTVMEETVWIRRG